MNKKNLYIKTIGFAILGCLFTVPFIKIGLDKPFVILYPFVGIVLCYIGFLAKRIRVNCIRLLAAVAIGFGILWAGINTVIVAAVGWLLIFETILGKNG